LVKEVILTWRPWTPKAVVLNRGPRPSGGTRNFQGARALTCSTTWNVFERKCVSSKRYASANFTPLHVIWFSSCRDESRG